MLRFRILINVCFCFPLTTKSKRLSKYYYGRTLLMWFLYGTDRKHVSDIIINFLKTRYFLVSITATKVSKYEVFSGSYIPLFRLNVGIYLRIQSEYRKIRTRKNSFSGSYFPISGLNVEIYSVNLQIQSEYKKIRTRETPYLHTFHAVINLLLVNEWINEKHILPPCTF